MSEYFAIVIWFNLSSSLYSSTVTVCSRGGGEEGGGKEGERVVSQQSSSTGTTQGMQIDSVQNCYVIDWLHVLQIATNTRRSQCNTTV